MKRTSLMYGGIIVLLTLSPVTAFAQAHSTSGPSIAASAKAAAATRLADAKLRSCQAREAALQKRSNQLTKLATNMQDTFTSISTRVKTYYTETVLPSGKTLSNYDTLIATIATKQAEVGTALTKAQSDVTAFSCTSDDPKGQIALFRTDMQAVKTALKAYRTSIKDLIVAIRTLTGTTQSTASPTASASPTTSPTVTP
jgi:hypothetical protein